MAIHVVNEARRCLHCKKPMCREGCPINTNIPEVIELFRTGHKEDAGAMLYENNPLSVICSLVCDHDKQCEGHCVLGRKGAPVHFSSIENYISDSYLDHLHLEMQPKTGQRVAIIGSGPAGITISILLAQRGYQVTMFESREKIGGVLRYGIPEFRLPKSILDRYQKQLTQLGIRIRRSSRCLPPDRRCPPDPRCRSSFSPVPRPSPPRWQRAGREAAVHSESADRRYSRSWCSPFSGGYFSLSYRLRRSASSAHSVWRNFSTFFRP